MDQNLDEFYEEIYSKYEEMIEGGIFLEKILFCLLLKEREENEWLKFKLSELQKEKI